jgi:endogenous inhibitor of DNA gyrase (YacG/DUF329 family)
MATLKCPHCGNRIESERTWAQAAVSTLIPASAIPDMATQVRCAKCGRVSAASDLRSDTADKLTKPHLALWIVGVVVVVWAVFELMQL